MCHHPHAAQARTANNLVGSLFAVLTTASTLGGLAQGGLAYANKDIRESAKQLLDGSLALSLAVDAMPLPALTKKAIKGNADRLKTISGSLLSLADGGWYMHVDGADDAYSRGICTLVTMPSLVRAPGCDRAGLPARHHMHACSACAPGLAPGARLRHA